MAEPPNDLESLQRRLERVVAAWSPPPPLVQGARPRPLLENVRRMAWGAAAGLGLGAAASNHLAMLVPAAVLAVVAGALSISGVRSALVENLPAGVGPRDSTRPKLGMGASVATGAIVEPGATVEMGASVGRGAVIRRGAVVRMGASVGAGAVLEENAVVGWGASVGRNGRVGRDAVVGAGSSVADDAAVPERMRLAPGTSWAQRAQVPAAEAPSAPVDPRVARVEAACARIEAELAQASPGMRERLGGSAQTAAALRQTCGQLLERERLLRAESSPESVHFLEQEKAVLQKRIDAASDEAVRRSLHSAVAAIEEQLRQRALLRLSAERLDAELTRLSWTLDGMGAQLVRLRTASQELAAAPDATLMQSMHQLHDEIEAIAGALESVARDDRGLTTPVVDVASGPSQPGARERERG